MAALEVGLGRGAPLAPDLQVREQLRQPPARLRVMAGRVQARERGVGQDVDRRTASASWSSLFAAPAESPSR